MRSGDRPRRAGSAPGDLPVRHCGLLHEYATRFGSIMSRLFLGMGLLVTVYRMADWKHGQYIRGAAGLSRREPRGGRGVSCRDGVDGGVIAAVGGHHGMRVCKPAVLWAGSYKGRQADIRKE